MTKRSLQVRRLGRVEYGPALELQARLEQEVIDKRGTNHLLLLEHPHTYTLGRRGKSDGVLATAEILEKLGASVHETNRGGKVTYHGLGQVVGYPVLDLTPDRQDVHLYMRDLERVLVAVLSDFGIDAFQIEGLTGVHTSEGKIAAIGVHIKRWVTTHGFALNVNTDLSYFDWIIACEGEPVTSMERLLGNELQLEEVENAIVRRFADVFDFKEVIEAERTGVQV